MRRALLLALPALPAAVPAQAAPWPARTIVAGESFHLGVDVLPDGRVATLVARRAGGHGHLELRVGSSPALELDTTRHSFESDGIRHDARGRLVVAWARVGDAGGVRQAFAWTAATGRRQLSTGRRGVFWVSLAVAPDGAAAVAFSSAEGVSVARGTAARGLRAAEVLAAAAPPPEPAPGFPDVGVAQGGTTVVTWTRGAEVAVARAPRGRPFGAARPIALPPPRVAGDASFPRVASLLVTPGGRAVIVADVLEQRDGAETPVGARLVGADWPAGSASLTPARVLSRGGWSGDAAMAARGEIVTVAWKAAVDGRHRPRTLAARAWGRGAPGPAIVRRPATDVGASLYDPPVLTAGPGPGVELFYGTSAGSWLTAPVTTGRIGASSAVTPPGRRVELLAAASGAGRTAVVWTAQLGPRTADYRAFVAERPS